MIVGQCCSCDMELDKLAPGRHPSLFVDRAQVKIRSEVATPWLGFPTLLRVTRLEAEEALRSRRLPASAPMLPAGCTGTIESSADNCRTTYDEACLLPLNKGTSQLKGVATWTTDSSSAHEVTELTIFDPTGQLLCSGTYDITDTKL